MALENLAEGWAGTEETEAVSKARLNHVPCLKLRTLTWSCALGLDKELPSHSSYPLQKVSQGEG